MTICCRLWIVLGVTVAVTQAGPGFGQTTLDRLESQIRQPAADAAGGSAGPALPAPLPQPYPRGPELLPTPAPPSSSTARLGPGDPARRPYLGMVVDDTNDRGQGLRVLKVHPGGPGAQAGFQPQDLITGVAAMRVRYMQEFADILDLHSAGDRVDFEILRGAQPKRLTMTFGQRPGTTDPGTTAGNAPGAPALPRPDSILPPPPSENTPAGPVDLSRMAFLERRLAELERRVADLEQALRGQQKSEPKDRPRLFPRPAPRPNE